MNMYLIPIISLVFSSISILMWIFVICIRLCDKKKFAYFVETRLHITKPLHVANIVVDSVETGTRV
jgi:hypothetical protein